MKTEQESLVELLLKFVAKRWENEIPKLVPLKRNKDFDWTLIMYNKKKSLITINEMQNELIKKNKEENNLLKIDDGRSLQLISVSIIR